jgi:hypothetical protein
MDRETMEYSLNQNVVFLAEDALLGRLSDEEYERIVGTKLTGKVTGHFSDNFIVTLFQALSNGETSVLVAMDACKPLSCHWCQDRKLVPAGSFTLGQHEANAIPKEACPYC